MKITPKWFSQLPFSRTVLSLIIGFLFSLCVYPPSAVSQFSFTEPEDEPNRREKRIEFGVDHLRSDSRLTTYVNAESADVAVEQTIVYPGSENFLVTIFLKNPVSLAGFDFEIIITPPELADFSPVRIYVDSMDTCPAPETTCWFYFPIRECLVVPGSEIDDWFLAAHGAPQDTSQPMCDTVWMLGLTIMGPYLPPHANYVPLLQFGVDATCVPDSLTNRTATFTLTGHLSDPEARLVPFRSHPGSLTIFQSVPGDANIDSLVGLYNNIVNLKNIITS